MLTMLAFAAATLQTSGVPTCAGLTLADLACAQTPYGVVLGDDQAMADRFAEVMRQGEGRFRRHFGREPMPYAVVVGDRANPVSESGTAGFSNVELQTQLRDAGALHVQPWFTTEQRERMRTATMRRSAEARARAQGLEGAALASAIEQGVAAAARAATPLSRAADSGAAHELGHVWTVSTFWPDYRRGENVQNYGGPAPDWFDELSAVLLEDDDLSAERRDQFRKVRAQPGGVRAKPLASFLADPHPNAGRSGPLPDLLAGDQLPPGARRVRAEDLPPGILPPAGAPGPGGAPRTFTATMASGFNGGVGRDELNMFYAQVRVFADFMMERTGDPGIYGRIAATMAQGKTMEQWIAAEGPALGLGGSVVELEGQWQDWLTRNYGAAG